MGAMKILAWFAKEMDTTGVDIKDEKRDHLLVHDIVHSCSSFQGGLTANQIGREVNERIATTKIRILSRVRKTAGR